MIVHLLDGTYELFRHFYGIRRAKKTDPPFGAVAGVLHTVAEMLEGGATHLGVATDHVRAWSWLEGSCGGSFGLRSRLVVIGIAEDVVERHVEDARDMEGHLERWHRAGAARSVHPARGGACRDGRDRVADD